MEVLYKPVRFSVGVTSDARRERGPGQVCRAQAVSSLPRRQVRKRPLSFLDLSVARPQRSCLSLGPASSVLRQRPSTLFHC